MKKVLFFIVALASVAVGCTKSEVVKAPGRGREIKFDTYVGKTPETKAETADLRYIHRSVENGGGFQVFGFLHEPINEEMVDNEMVYTQTELDKIGTTKAYMNKVVTWAQTTADDPNTPEYDPIGAYDYQGVVYWPDYSTQRKLAFAAYGLNVTDNIEWVADDKVTDTAHAGKSYTQFTYTVPEAVADQKDLIVAEFLPNMGLSAPTSPNEETSAATVTFDFKHLLSRISFQVFANQNSENVKIDIQEVRITNTSYFPEQGTVDLKGPGVITPITGEGAQTHQTYELFPETDFFRTSSNMVASDIYANTDADGNAITDADPANRYMMIMPCKIGEGSYIQVKYQLTDSDPYEAKVNIDQLGSFLPGTSYIFKFKVSTTSIEFGVDIQDWTEYFQGENGDGTQNLIPLS